MDILKPCPFGHSRGFSINFVIVDSTMVAVECGCGAQGPTANNERTASALWNQRKDSAQ